MVDLKLAESIARGEVRLLDIDTIVARLGISRSTFERWLRNGKPLRNAAGSSLGGSIHAGMLDRVENHRDGHTTFPGPDVMIGKAPRWEEQTLVRWIMENSESVKK